MIAAAMMLSHCGWQLGGGEDGDGLGDSFGADALLLIPSSSSVWLPPKPPPSTSSASTGNLCRGATLRAEASPGRAPLPPRPPPPARQPALQRLCLCPRSFRSCGSRGSCARLGRGLRGMLGLGTALLHQDTIKKGSPVLSSESLATDSGVCRGLIHLARLVQRSCGEQETQVPWSRIGAGCGGVPNSPWHLVVRSHFPHIV